MTLPLTPSMLSPGVKFLISCIPGLLVQLLCIAVVYYEASRRLGVGLDLPIYLKVSGTIVLLVLFAFIRNIWGEIQKNRDAKSRGAIRAPVTRGYWPGNADLLRFSIETEKSGYLGMHLRELSCS